MPGGRVPKSTRNDPGNKPDKGLEGGGQHHIAPPGPKPSKVGPASVMGEEKFEGKPYDQVVANKREGSSQHSGAPDGSGPGPSFAAQAASRGIIDKGSMFSSVSGHGKPKRSAGRKTQASDIDKLKTAGP
jgi:hypothetical protein